MILIIHNADSKSRCELLYATLALCLLDKGSTEKCKEHTCGLSLFFSAFTPLFPYHVIWSGEENVCAHGSGFHMLQPEGTKGFVLVRRRRRLLSLVSCRMGSLTFSPSKLVNWESPDGAEEAEALCPTGPVQRHGTARQLQVTSPAPVPPLDLPYTRRECMHCNKSNLKLNVCFTSDKTKCSLTEWKCMSCWGVVNTA